MERSTYISIPDYDRDTALREIDSGITDRVVLALLSLAFYDPDWRWVQNLCVNFSKNLNDNIRGVAILCFSHLAHIHRELDTEITVPIVIDGLKDPSDYVRGTAEDTLEEILMFCTPKDYDRAAALELLRSERIDKTLLGLFAIAKRDRDSKFAEGKCIEYSTHPNEVIRGQALKGFATIVWEHREIDVEKAIGILSEAAKKEGYAVECARSAIDCIETYLEGDDGV